MGEEERGKELDEILRKSIEEVEEIKKDIASDESLKHIEVTPAMDRAMEKMIEIYERDQASKDQILKEQSDHEMEHSQIRIRKKDSLLKRIINAILKR